jgi:hypothetical protein
LIEILSIRKNTFQASYLSGTDEYWTLYYYKPFSRIHSYLIGVFFGSAYFTFKVKDHKILSATVLVNQI